MAKKVRWSPYAVESLAGISRCNKKPARQAANYRGAHYCTIHTFLTILALSIPTDKK